MRFLVVLVLVLVLVLSQFATAAARDPESIAITLIEQKGTPENPEFEFTFLALNTGCTEASDFSVQSGIHESANSRRTRYVVVIERNKKDTCTDFHRWDPFKITTNKLVWSELDRPNTLPDDLVHSENPIPVKKRAPTEKK